MPKQTFSDRGRAQELRKLLAERILILDGAMGTALQSLNLTAADFGGPELEGCNENLVLTRPDAVKKIHADYLNAGADIIETNTFGGVRHVLDEYGLGDKTLELNRTAARLAVAAAKQLGAPEKPRFAAGCLGPGTKTISVTGGITFDEIRGHYHEAALGLLEGGVDLLAVETQQDTLNIKATMLGIHDAFDQIGRSVPLMLSVSIEAMGSMLGGQTVDALYHSISHFDLLAVGLNCATGPDFMTDHLRTLAELSSFPVLCYPNAGLPDEDGRYNESPEMVAAKLARFAERGWLNIAGGCCGTTPAYIRAIAKKLAGLKTRVTPKTAPAAVSGLEALYLDEDRRPILVGERTNVIGSRKFKKMIASGRFEEGAEIGRRQARGGAHILDICLANPDRDEKKDMILFLEALTKKVKTPLMIDSTDRAVIEEALKRSPGKAIINSINLEDGEKRFAEIVPLLRRYGATVIVGAIDEDPEQGMALTRARKLAVARRSYDLLTGKFGVPPEDIVFDPLTFPCATGDKNYFGSARETIEGIRLIKKELPRTKTVLGISNVSFGLPPAGREVLNAVFLHHCVEAGLDMALVNSEKLARFATLSGQEKDLADALLFWGGPDDRNSPKGVDPIAAFAAHYRDAKPLGAAASERSKLPIDERLARNVVEGSKEGLIDDLERLVKEETRPPLEIVNGSLMAGMNEVGKLFGANKLIVAEVLQSAEVMKAAVAYLEPFMDNTAAAAKGRVLLATVKGDVHDIGKNLVHIILKNNGFEVVDLGIKVAPETLIKKIREISPDILGLSGLLVRSARQMIVTAEDLNAAGIRIPILVGGAALSPKFTAGRIAPQHAGPTLYCKDAMMGLDFANRLQDAARKDELLAENAGRQKKIAAAVAINGARPAAAVEKAMGEPMRYDHNIPAPPDLNLHVLEDYDPRKVFEYINPIMLYGHHLGLKGRPDELYEKGDPKAVELYNHMRTLQDEVTDNRLIRPKGVLRFFAANGEGDDLVLYDSYTETREVARFTFPRQSGGHRHCLADLVLPKSTGRLDSVALFAVTCGIGVRPLAERWRDEGEYLKSHAFQALALEGAEAFAERLHKRIRSMWGIPDPAELTIKECFQALYRGRRYSPGYPACPELNKQAIFWRLLEPEKRIGVTLTEDYMMDPEASVSAIVFHHPQAHYFSVGAAQLA